MAANPDIAAVLQSLSDGYQTQLDTLNDQQTEVQAELDDNQDKIDQLTANIASLADAIAAVS